ncbi:MAG: NAD(+)/NADH kinase [Actinobacteria bacterium]|nr:NAD(+)/NADH kinase [Actinomycetota bacterium]
MVTNGGGQLPAVVVNGARVQDLARLRRACERAASAAGWQAPMMLPTTGDDSGVGQARAAVEAGAALVVAVGGDGTVRACAQVLAGGPVPLAIIPAGTANLTARALGVPTRLDAALEVAFHGRNRSIDLGNADGQVFVAMAGIGLDAAVVGAAHRLAKRLAGWPAYALAATGQLLRRPVSFTIRLDGGEPLTRQARCVTVGSSGALPGGFAILPDARPDDGRLDVVVLAPAGLLGWADVGYRVALGSRRDDVHLERYQASAVEIRADLPAADSSRRPVEAPAELPRQLDGELIGPARSLSVSVLPGALLVRVPS